MGFPLTMMTPDWAVWGVIVALLAFIVSILALYVSFRATKASEVSASAAAESAKAADRSALAAERSANAAEQSLADTRQPAHLTMHVAGSSRISFPRTNHLKRMGLSWHSSEPATRHVLVEVPLEFQNTGAKAGRVVRVGLVVTGGLQASQVPMAWSCFTARPGTFEEPERSAAFSVPGGQSVAKNVLFIGIPSANASDFCAEGSALSMRIQAAFEHIAGVEVVGPELEGKINLDSEGARLLSESIIGTSSHTHPVVIDVRWAETKATDQASSHEPHQLGKTEVVGEKTQQA